MNQRVRALAEQAGMWKVVHFPHLTDEESQSIEKFAELIVQECIGVVASRPYVVDGSYSHPATMIEQHFESEGGLL